MGIFSKIKKLNHKNIKLRRLELKKYQAKNISRMKDTVVEIKEITKGFGGIFGGAFKDFGGIFKYSILIFFRKSSAKRKADAKIICPHCHSKGYVTTKQKKLIEKTTSSVGFLWVSRDYVKKSKVTELHCSNCQMIWIV